MIPEVVGALGAVTPKLREWFQKIPGIMLEIFVQKSTIMETAKI